MHAAEELAHYESQLGRERTHHFNVLLRRVVDVLDIHAAGIGGTALLQVGVGISQLGQEGIELIQDWQHVTARILAGVRG